jgi:hypothetical protein
LKFGRCALEYLPDRRGKNHDVSSFLLRGYYFLANAERRRLRTNCERKRQLCDARLSQLRSTT